MTKCVYFVKPSMHGSDVATSAKMYVIKETRTQYVCNYDGNPKTIFGLTRFNKERKEEIGQFSVWDSRKRLVDFCEYKVVKDNYFNHKINKLQKVIDSKSKELDELKSEMEKYNRQKEYLHKLTQ